jgi:Flp pilus assembly protein TadD
MSVLFKALSKASKANAGAGEGMAGQRPTPSSGGGLRSQLPKVLAVFGGAAALVFIGLTLFGESSDTAPGAGRATRPTPQLRVAGQTPASPKTITTPAQAIPQTTPVASSPSVAQATLTQQPQTVSQVQETGALSSRAAVVTPQGVQPAAAKPIAPTAQTKVALAQTRSEPLPKDEDLPALLDRMRRSRSSAANALPVDVAHGNSPAELINDEGRHAISVAVAPMDEHEDAETAYDMLLRGDYSEAVRYYDRALRRAPNNVTLLLGKATADHKLKPVIDAEKSYRRVLQIDPGNREALTNMAAILANQAPDQALNDLRGLLRSDPTFSPIYAQIASLEADGGNIDASLQSMQSALHYSPDNALYRLNYAVMLDRAGRAPQALDAYITALDLSNGSPNLPMPLDQIRSRIRYLQGR